MGVSRDCLIFGVPPIISETGEATNVKFCTHIHRIDRIIGAKVHKNMGKSSRGRSQWLSKIFRAAIYRAHRAVLFAIAQLSWFLRYRAFKIFRWWRHPWRHDAWIDYPWGPFGRTMK